jgi:hypothetical protein
VKIKLLTAALNKAGRPILTMQKYSPVLMFGAGIVGVAATVVLACRATLKLEGVLDEAQDLVDKAKTLEHSDYSERDRERDIALVYTKMAFKIVKLYSPAVATGVLAIGSLTGAHMVLSRRNVGLAAAFAALDKGFKEYRQRVIGEVGEDREREIRYGAVDREIVEETKTGPVVKGVRSFDPNVYSPYARLFDEHNQNWQKNAEYNLLFVRAQQNYANDMLGARGHVFLNEVYDMLGIDHSSAGAVVGWVISKDGGDNFIDFGVFNPANERANDFVNGRERSILLDFNVDGVIYDKI